MKWNDITGNYIKMNHLKVNQIKVQHKWKVFAAIVGFAVLSVGCGGKEEAVAESGKPIVAVTIIPEQTFVEAVCKDKVEIVTMVPPGSSPETYEPAPMEMEQFSDADIYFSIGAPIEETYILPFAGEVKTVGLHEAAAQKYPDRLFENGDRDPHIWLSPKRVMVMVDKIAEEMSILDEANRAFYEQNAQEYKKELEETDAAIKEALAGVKNPKFVVFHPAFGYLADDYGLEMFSLEEEGKEATAAHLQEMIDLAKAENIKVIFYQEEIDSSQSEAYAEEIGGKTAGLEPLAADYTENLKKMAAVMAEAME